MRIYHVADFECRRKNIVKGREELEGGKVLAKVGLEQELELPTLLRGNAVISPFNGT